MHFVRIILMESGTQAIDLLCRFPIEPDDTVLVDDPAISTFMLSAELVLTLLKDGSYRKHMEAVRSRLAKAMSRTIARLKPMGLKPWILPGIPEPSLADAAISSTSASTCRDQRLHT